MQKQTDAVVVMVAVPDLALAESLSARLLADELVACCQTLGPMQSRYRWQGRIESATEHLLLFKTRSVRLAAVESAIVAMHPYDVPEILVLPVLAGNAPYLAWLHDQTGADDA